MRMPHTSVSRPTAPPPLARQGFQGLYDPNKEVADVVLVLFTSDILFSWLRLDEVVVSSPPGFYLTCLSSSEYEAHVHGAIMEAAVVDAEDEAALALPFDLGGAVLLRDIEARYAGDLCEWRPSSTATADKELSAEVQQRVLPTPRSR